ncbi:MAG TPA: DUF998 domain-containing protein [Lapillicoccus sp.]|jgi:hypothetical membrane protein|uniref:DUF998 domain-containing protein n=1 Tax=Lapillicoccus sp. TaxID=1909287 RepID=UPI002F94AC16
MTTTYLDPRTLSAAARVAAKERACADPSTRVTRSLAGYGVIAGPVYVGVSLAQVLTRDGFDLGRHAWSQLAIGDWGWIQTANLVATGLMSLAFSVALRRTLVGGRGGRSVPVLVAVFGLGVLLAGVFPADPAGGYPVGMATPTTPTLHGMLHLMTSGVGFLALAAAMVVMAVRYAAEHRRGRSAFSVVAAVALLGGFGTIASGSGAGVAAFTTGIITALTWLSLLGVDTYSRATYARR